MDPVSNACGTLFDLTSERLVVAFSGGMDSTVLLHGVAEAARCRAALDRVVAVHVDHGLSADSGRWAEECARTAKALGVGFERHSLGITQGSNLEARARAGRYRIFHGLLETGDLLLLAHHAGDQTESLLLHLFQGRGLYGMPTGRPLGAGSLYRPFLTLPRETLAGYARTHGLSWIEDPANADPALDRNFLRHSLLPALNERFQGLFRRLTQVAEGVVDTGLALDELAALDRRPLPLEVLDGLSRPARLAVLRRWLTRQGINASVTRVALTEFLRQLEAGNDRQPRLDLPAGSLIRYRRAIHFAPPPPTLEKAYRISVPGRLSLPHGELSIERSDDAGCDPPEVPGETVRLAPPVRIVFVTGLDVPAELVHKGHRRTIRTLMREAGVPPWLRDGLPLICDADGIALIPGVAGRDGASGEPVNVRWEGEVR